MNMAANAAWWRCCFFSPEQGQHKTWLRPRRGEERAPPGAVRGHVGAAREQQQQRGLRSRLPCWAGTLGKRLAASSGMRDGRRPQQCFPKRCLRLFLLGSGKPVLFCCWGWWWGMRESCLVGVFKNTLEDKREQGAKILLCLRKIQFYQLPSCPSAAVRHHGQLSAYFSAARHPKCFVRLTRGQPGGLQQLASSLGLHFISSAESHQWPSVLLTSGTFP